MGRKIKQVLGGGGGGGRENMAHGETEQMSNSELIDCTRESEKLRMREIECRRWEGGREGGEDEGGGADKKECRLQE